MWKINTKKDVIYILTLHDIWCIIKLSKDITKDNAMTESEVFMEDMNMKEAARVIIALRSAGWTEKAINDFILFVETGEEQYKPKEKEKADQ